MTKTNYYGYEYEVVECLVCSEKPPEGLLENGICNSCQDKRISLLTAPTAKIWLRLGVTLSLTGAQATRLLEGESSVIQEALDSGNWKWDGDTYIPHDESMKYGYEGDIEL
jgi:hypothetical protein